jgi:hypothetical protein
MRKVVNRPSPIFFHHASQPPIIPRSSHAEATARLLPRSLLLPQNHESLTGDHHLSPMISKMDSLHQPHLSHALGLPWDSRLRCHGILLTDADHRFHPSSYPQLNSPIQGRVHNSDSYVSTLMLLPSLISSAPLLSFQLGSTMPHVPTTVSEQDSL